MSVDASLENITALREQLRAEKPKVLARAREIAEQNLAKLEAALNAACRAAHDDGASYAAIGRALGTKDFSTAKRRVESAAPTNVAVANEFRREGINLLSYRGQPYEAYRYVDTGVVQFYTAEEGAPNELDDTSSEIYKRAVAFAESEGILNA